MKILILAPYSKPSQCGIWKRVWDDTKILKDTNEVTILTSNILKGTLETLPKEENFEGVKIKRFKVFFKLGGTSMFWFPIVSIIKSRADVIHTHGYRHPHSLQALVLGKLLRKKVILTTHAPFVKDSRRSNYLKLIDKVYDLLIGWWELKLYNKIIRISNWETPYLNKLHVSNKKIVFIPNSIDDIFFTKADNFLLKDKHSKLVFTGRIDPVKRADWIVDIAKDLKDLNFEILGPIQGYDNFEAQSSNIVINNKPYTKEDELKLFDSSDIYLFPSIRESFGMTALEAMARGLIVIATDTLGVKEYLKNGVNGFIVNTKDDMKERITDIYKHFSDFEEIRIKAIETASNYKFSENTKKLVDLYSEI